MSYFLLCLAAACTSALTLWTGFGLGTLLLPFFILVMPVELAVAATAVVHLLNNLFKLALVGRQAMWRIVARFGLPAMLSAWVGARVFVALTTLAPLATYELRGSVHTITLIKVAIALLMVVFALFDVLPRFQRVTFAQRWLPVGGCLSGFFGGLSGHQGALRSAFLMKCGLTPQQYIATGVVIACLVDVSRLFVYSRSFASLALGPYRWLLTAATLSAFLGAWCGARLMPRMTLSILQRLVAVLLLLIACGLATGLL